MKFFSRLIFSFFSNIIALWAVSYFIEGFEINYDLRSFILVGAVFTVLNIFLRPILKLILSPVIVLTLGLGVILVNALILYLLDFILIEISINGLLPLIYATLIISIINILIHFSAKSVYIKQIYLMSRAYSPAILNRII